MMIIHGASNRLSSQLKEIIGVQLGLEWFRLNNPWFSRKNAHLSQTNMLARVPKFQLELFCHPLQVGYKFPQLFNLSATMDIRFWKEALLELNPSLIVDPTKLHEPSITYRRTPLLTGTPSNVPSSLRSAYDRRA